MRRGRQGRLLLLRAAALVAIATTAGAPGAGAAGAEAAGAGPAGGRQRAQSGDAVGARDHAAPAATLAQAAADAAAQRLTAARIAAATALRGTERATLDAMVRLAALAARRDAAERALAARAAALAPMLPVIERLSLYPAETVLAVPAPPDRALTGLLVIQGIGADLGRQAAALSADRSALDRLALAEQQAVARLAAARQVQAAQEAALDRQLADTAAARQLAANRAGMIAAQDAAEARVRAAAAAAARAKTLGGAIAALATDRRSSPAGTTAGAAGSAENGSLGSGGPGSTSPRPTNTSPRATSPAAEPGSVAGMQTSAAGGRLALAKPSGFGIAGGQFTAPVAGRLMRRWGQPTEDGPATGLSYRAAPGARVVAPCVGRIDFAAPFRSFGLLLIVDCGGGYRLVLSGLGRLDIAAGRPVAAGEPVGVMPSGMAVLGTNPPVLYLELRRDGAAIDPEPYLRGSG